MESIPDTVWWVLLILAVVVIFRKQLEAILAAVRERLAGGSGFSLLGHFIKIDEMRPSSVDEQKKRTAEKIRGALESEPERDTPGRSAVAERHLTPARYFLVEDLVFRAIQGEYRTLVQRHVILGTDFEIDGLFFAAERLSFIEVIHCLEHFRPERMRSAVRHVSSAVQREKTLQGEAQSSVRIVLAVVLESGDAKPLPDELAAELRSLTPFPVAVHSYSVRELEAQFGITIPVEC